MPRSPTTRRTGWPAATFPVAEDARRHTRAWPRAHEQVGGAPFPLDTAHGPRVAGRLGSRALSSRPAAAAPIAVLRALDDGRAELPARERDERERLGRELEAILARRRGRRDRPGPRRHARLRQRRRGPAARHPVGYADRAALLAADPREVAARLEILSEDGGRSPLERLPGRRALAGEDARADDRALPRPRQPARPAGRASRRSRCSTRPAGRLGDQRRSRTSPSSSGPRRRQRFLAEAGRVLAGSLDYEETLRRVAGSPCPRSPTGAGSTSLGERRARARRGRARRPGAAGLAARCAACAVDYPADPGTGGGRAHAAAASATRSCRRDHRRDARGDRASREHLRRCARSACSSAMVVPMRVRGRPIGAITFVSAESGPALRRRATWRSPRSLALRAAAGDRQRAAVPPRARRSRGRCRPRCCRRVLPEIPGLELGARVPRRRARARGRRRLLRRLLARPRTSGSRSIGDVCGKGAEAAAVTALARYTIRAAAVRRRSPAAILRWLSEAMLRQAAATAASARSPACTSTSRARRRGSTVACGGHPLPLRAARRRRGRGARRAGHAARPRRATRARGPLGRAARRATRSCSTRTADRGAGARAVWSPEDLDAGARAALRRPRRRRRVADAAGARRVARTQPRAARRHRGRRAARAAS